MDSRRALGRGPPPRYVHLILELPVFADGNRSHWRSGPHAMRSATSPEGSPPAPCILQPFTRSPAPYSNYNIYNTPVPQDSHHNQRGRRDRQLPPSIEERLAQLELRQRESEEENQWLRRRNNELEAELARPVVRGSGRQGYSRAEIDSDDYAPGEMDILPPAPNPVFDDCTDGPVPQIEPATRRLAPYTKPANPMSSVSQNPVVPSVQPAAGARPPVKPAVLVSLGLPHKDLTKDQQEVRSKITRRVGSTFRNLCGITAQEPWPDPSVVRIDSSTGEHLFTPNFPGGVTDRNNVKLIDAVADEVLRELEDPDCRPAKFDTCGATVDRHLLQAFAKESFKGFKKQYKTQVDEVALANKIKAKAKDRREQRRKAKHGHRLEAVPQYATEHNLNEEDIAAAIDPEHMSDEFSEPDPDDKDADKLDWAVRMAKATGRMDATRQSVQDLRFLEVSKLAWRTDEATNFNLELSQIYEDSLTETDKDKRKYIRVRGTTRMSKRVPNKAPFNFAVRPDWLADQMKDAKMAQYLTSAGWGTYPGPCGHDPDLEASGTPSNVDANNMPIESHSR
ncbi:unnamed protein product [Mycena citricolor]|uniref:Uncharacterized protein n=1 Tax=Mycena citricolor TaxID=2018698 RepID=A0AAD2HAE3_9AGAR|nr:unnamed protein product [Mycena citricolor]